MNIDGYTFMVDAVAKFHFSVFVQGWFLHETDRLRDVAVEGHTVVDQVVVVPIRHGSVDRDSQVERGFRVQALCTSDAFDESLILHFLTQRGKEFRVPLSSLAEERTGLAATPRIYRQFQQILRGMPQAVVIDVGGRDRSKFDREVDFPNTRYVVVDIMPGDNVDIVGDAHELSRFVAPGSADAVISAFTFEHLLMPWKAVVEINRVLKPGGIATVFTHQTLGMHDLPWDFWRFSADAWDALFNAYTGFRILDRAMASEQYIVPFLYTRQKAFAERGAGYEFSAVLVEKSGEAVVDWPVPVRDVIETSYPDHEDGN